jgi:hypothetical protein
MMTVFKILQYSEMECNCVRKIPEGLFRKYSSVLLSGHLKIGGIEASRIPLDLTSISNGNSFSNLAFPHTDF